MPYKKGDVDYDAARRSVHGLNECQAVIGRRARLDLTGKIIGAGVSNTGPYVRFEIDERFGFAQRVFMLDLDPLEVA